MPATLSVAQALASVDGERTIWPVTDENGLRAMIAKDQLEAAAAGGFGEQTLGDLVPDPGPIGYLNEARFPHVDPDHSLQSAMQRLTQSGLAELPVVSRGNIRELRGTISAKDVLDALARGRPAAAVYVRHTNGIPACPPAEQRSWVTMSQAAELLKVSLMVVRRMIAEQILPARQVVKCAPWVIERADLELPAVRKNIRRVHEGRRSPLIVSDDTQTRLFIDSSEV
jgi:CBS domain-containing protein